MEKLRNLFARKDRQYGMVVVLVLIILLFQALTGGVLLKPLNVTNVILQNSYIMVLAIGMLLTILTGNIDLSVGSIAAFVGAVSGVLAIGNKMDPILAIVVSLVIGAVIGAWNGFWIAYVRIPAFIVTLGSQMIFRGLTMVILQGQTLSPFPSSYQIIGSGFVPDLFSGTLNMVAVFAGVFCMVVYSVSEILKRRKQKAYEIEVENRYSFYLKLLLVNAAFILFTYWMAAYQGIPTVLVLLAALIVLYSFITGHTIIGRHIYAFGGNEKAARLSGIRTKKVFFWVYVNMGVLSALAGIVYASRLNAATPKAGTNFELDAIAACYIGGASASGGIGTVAGAIIGSLVMGILNNGMSIMGIGVDWQQAIKGFVLILAVAFDIFSKKER
ncbi:MAG: sugar ABC transporter permease [Lachnospiraceae bacterium]|jgi:putative multiple sugar transport system permease protein|nr:sugar ABC transporter permease [Lachnospiraceae bacterium]